MINLNLFSRDEVFKESFKQLVVNVTKVAKLEDDIRIHTITGDSKTMMHNIENQISLGVGIDIYFIDVDDEIKREGLHLARDIRKKDALAYIIFVSGTNHNAWDLMKFGVKASGFFFKPIGTYELIDLIGEITFDSSQITYARTSNMKGHIVVKSGYKSNIIFLADIIFIEYERPKSRIETVYGTIEVNMTMQEIFDVLATEDQFGTFVRTHQSFIVNLLNAEIMDYRKLELIMKKGIRIPIARTRRKDVRAVQESKINQSLLTNLKVRK